MQLNAPKTDICSSSENKEDELYEAGSLHSIRCVICLSQVQSIDHAVASPCQHSDFDYECLRRWMTMSNLCPICKTPIDAIIYNIESDTVFDVEPLIVATSQSLRWKQHYQSQRRRWRLQHWRQRLISRARAGGIAANDYTSKYTNTQESKDKPGAGARRFCSRDEVYASHLRARLPKDAAATQRTKSHLSPLRFTRDEGLRTRTSAFLLHELPLIPFVSAEDANFLAGVFVDLLTKQPTEDAKTREFVAGFLGNDIADVLMHELRTFLESSFRSVDAFFNSSRLIYDEPSSSASTEEAMSSKEKREKNRRQEVNGDNYV